MDNLPDVRYLHTHAKGNCGDQHAEFGVRSENIAMMSSFSSVDVGPAKISTMKGANGTSLINCQTF